MYTPFNLSEREYTNLRCGNNKQHIVNNNNLLKFDEDWRDEGYDIDNNKCIICMKNRKQIAYSCGHYINCINCAKKVIDTTAKCPICNKNIIHIIKIIINNY